MKKRFLFIVIATALLVVNSWYFNWHVAYVSGAVEKQVHGFGPQLIPALASNSAFTKTTNGYQPKPEPPQAPAGLKPQEMQAWTAFAELHPAASDLVPTFPEYYSEGTQVRSQGMVVSLKPLGSNSSSAQIENGKLVYHNVYTATDSLNVVSEGRSEEFLLLHDASAPQKFEYDLSAVSGVKDISLQDNSVHFTNAQGQQLQIEAPWLMESGGQKVANAAHWQLSYPNGPSQPRLALVVNNAGKLHYPVVIDPSWIVTNGSLNTARFSHTATLLSNGQVLVAGGYFANSNNSTGLNSAELYDPTTGIWKVTGNLQTALYNHTATLLQNGQVLVAGGSTNSAITPTSELYNPATGTWTYTTGNLNSARQFHTATLLPGGQVLIVGGSNGSGTVLNSAELYNPATETWTVTGSLTTQRQLHTATLLPNGQVLVAGGATTNIDTTSATKTAELYNPTSGMWMATGNLNAARAQHTATLLPNGQVLVAGGSIGTSVAIASCELFNPASAPNGAWTPTGPLSTARYLHTATLLPNGQVLVAGGVNTGFASTSELFNPSNGTNGSWTTTASISTPCYSLTATLLSNGAVLIAGGDGASGSVSSTAIYDPSQGQGAFSVTGVPTTGRVGHTATLLPNGLVLVAGGQNSSGAISAAELFNPATGSWASTRSLNAARYTHTATLLPNGQVLVAGGFGSSNTAISSAELYNPGPGTWTVTGPLNTARDNHTATLLANGQVLVASGGNGPSNSNYLNSAELYNPATGMWTPTTGNLNAARFNDTATLLPNGQVLFAGGYNGGAQALATAELYNPANGMFTTTGNLKALREGHRANLLPNGMVLLEGGLSNSTAIFSAELYNPSTGSFTYTGNLNAARAFHTSTLLSNGQVLIAGGQTLTSYITSEEVYNPSTGMFSPTGGNLAATRSYGTATLLPNGQVLIAGGFNGSYLTEAELYNPGLGYSPATQPQVNSVSSINSTTNLSLTGTNFTGVSEASGGSYNNSSSNIPMVQLESLANEQVVTVPLSTFTATSYNGLPPGGIICSGYVLLTMYVNGTPSNSQIVSYNYSPDYWLGNSNGLWTGSNWASSATGTPMAPAPNPSTDVIFSATGAANETTTLGQDTTINSLTINDPTAVSIGGANTLTISGSSGIPGITVNSGAGLFTLSSNLALGGSSGTISVNNTAGAAISGSISGFLGLTKTGTGTLTLSGSNTYMGATTVSGGTLAVTGAPGSLGTSSSNIYLGYNSGDNGALVICNGASVNSSSTYLGFNSGSAGAATVTGTASTLNTDGGLYVGNQGQGSLLISNGGQVNSTGPLYSNGAGVASSGALIGGNSGSVGTATVTGVNANGTASTWSMGTNDSSLLVGVYGSGTLAILNGGLVSDSQGDLGVYQGCTGNVLISGVDAVRGKPSTWNNSFALTVGVGYVGSPNGYGGSGALTIEKGAIVTAPEVVIAGGIESNDTIVAGGTASGVINVDSGGILQTGRIVGGGGSLAINLNLNGGILQATSSSNSSGPYQYFLNNFTTGGVTLQSGGGTINTGSLNVTVAAPIGGPGALTKTGTGILTMASGNSYFYSGGTIVSNGTFALGSGSSLDSTGAVTANGTFDVSQAGNQNIGDLSGSGTVALGSYGLTVNEQALTDNTTFSGSIVDGGIGHGTGGQLAKTGLGTLNLTGSNSFTGNTTVNFGTLAVSGAGAAINSPNSTLTVGLNNLDSGNLLISNGGQVTSGTGVIGDNTGTSGSATVTGINASGALSNWNLTGGLTIGQYGTGSLDIENGGLVSNPNGNGMIGLYQGSNGTVTVNGVNANGTPSTWNTYQLYVSDAGTGTLTISNGAVVTSALTAWITFGAQGGVGTLNLNSNGLLVVPQILGGGGTSATFNINGGTLRASASNTNFLSGFNGGNLTLGSLGGTIDNNGFNITDTSGYFGAGALTLTGSGVTTFNGGNFFTGGTTINQGATFALGSGGSLYSTGAVAVNGKFDISQSTNQSIGDLSGSGMVALGSYGLTVTEQALTDNTTFSGSIVDGGLGNGTGGQLTKSGLGTLNLTGSNSYTGSTTINLGTLNVSGTGATINSPGAVFDVGLNNGDNGSLLISNGGVVTNSQADIGSAFGSKGTATVTGAGSVWNAGNQNFNIGNSGSGILNIQNGGTVTDNLGVIANAPSSSGTVTVTGVNSTWNNARLFVGNAGTGMLTISSGGVVTSTLTAYITDEPGETTEIGTLNLDSNGVLLAPQIVNGSNSTNAAFNINGGILRATGSSSDFISNFSSNQVTIQSGGATIDSNVFNISILSNLNGAIGGGGLTKVGAGTLTLAGTNSYTGMTTINGGTVSVGSILAPLSAQPLGESSSIVFGGTSPTAPTTLEYTGGTQSISQNITVNSGAYGEIYNSGTGVMTLTGSLNISGATFALTGSNIIVSSAITGSSPNSNLDIGSDANPGSTTVGLRSANSYNGATVISQGSTLLLGKQNALPSTTAVTIGAASDGSETNTLDLLGNSETVAGLFSAGSGTNQVISSNGSVPLGGTPAIGSQASPNLATLTVNYSLTGTDIYGGFLGEGDSNNTRNANKLELIKSGTGILALSNANTYTGSTEVQSGTLMIQNGTNGSATGSGSLTVDPGATFGGAGTVQDTDLQHGININGTLIVGSGTDYTSKTYLVAPASVSFQNATLQFNLFQTPGSINGQNNTLYLPSSLVGSTLEPTSVSFNNTTLQLNLASGSSPIGFNTIYNLISTTTLNASNATNYGLTLGADGKQITGGLTISNTSNLGPDFSGAYIYFSGDNIELQGQLSNFAINPPPTPSSGQGSILVNLSPASAGGWQLQGEQLWRPAGSTVTGLTNGSYTIEFEPMPGYIEPSPQSVTISGTSSLTISGTYYPVTTGANGTLEIVLNTSNLLPNTPSTGWRISGQTAWQSSGAAVSLAPGTYLIECEPVSLPVDTNGNNQYVTTPVSYVTVTSGQMESATLIYPAPTSSVGNAPQVLPFGTQTSTLPYAFVGQIRTNAGVATGFVVEEHVVATAAHVIFNDSSLAYATEIQWIFQRSAGTYDPPPQTPQGYYMSSSYSELRTQAIQQGGTAGVENTASENLDVAALYFLGNADGTTTGTGSYSGYLASDSVPNQFLSPTGTKLMATLVGYPVDGISSSQQGQAFYTTPVRATFSLVTGTDTTGTGGIDAEPNTTGLAYQVYTSTSLSSVGGNSGGPLCLLYDAGDGNGPQYRPAAIYLGGNSWQSNFKAIDGLAVDLFTRAQASANAGVQHLGGGITSVNSPLQGKLVTSTAVQVTVLPLSASSSSASNWNLTSGTDTFSGKYPFPSGFEYQTTSTGNATVYFGSVQGFLTPPPLPVTLTAGQVTEVTATYEGITANPSDAATAANSPATFSVSVSGTPTAYQWMKNGTAISGATSAIYALSSPTLADAGAYSVKVTWGSDGPLTSNAANLTVVPLTQFITFPTIGNQVYGTAPITLAAFSSSGLPINYTVTSGPATVSGTQLNQLTFTGTGSVTVQANQPGDGATYSAALSVPQTFLITPPTQITFAQWLTQYVVNGGATGTPLHDGVQNEIKYLCDINPTTAMSATDRAALPGVGIDTTSTPGTQYLELTYRQYSGLTGTSVHFQTSTNLINWTTVTPDLTKQTPLASGDSTIELGVKINPAVKAEYIRLNLTTP